MGSGASSKLKDAKLAFETAEYCRTAMAQEFDTNFKEGLLNKLNISSATSIVSLKEVNLSGRNIGCHTTLAQNAARLLNLAVFCKSANLSNTGMDGVAFVKFVEKLEDHNYIENMDLHGNPFGSRSDEKRVGLSIASLVGKLVACQGKGKFHLQDCGLEKKHLQFVQKATEDWSPGMFPEVYLSGNNLGGGNTIKIGEALAHVYNLCPAARCISLARCGLDLDALKTFTEQLETHIVINEIDLVCNKLGPGKDVGKVIGKLMSRCADLRKSFLYRCNLDGVVLQGIVEQWNEMNVVLENLEVLDLSGDELFAKSNVFKGGAAGTWLGKVTLKCPALRTLNIQNCGFDNDAADAVCRIYKDGEHVNTTLEHFRCFDSELKNNANYELAMTLFEWFPCAKFSFE